MVIMRTKSNPLSAMSEAPGHARPQGRSVLGLREEGGAPLARALRRQGSLLRGQDEVDEVWLGKGEMTDGFHQVGVQDFLRPCKSALPCAPDTAGAVMGRGVSHVSPSQEGYLGRVQPRRDVRRHPPHHGLGDLRPRDLDHVLGALSRTTPRRRRCLRACRGPRPMPIIIGAAILLVCLRRASCRATACRTIQRAGTAPSLPAPNFLYRERVSQTPENLRNHPPRAGTRSVPRRNVPTLRFMIFPYTAYTKKGKKVRRNVRSADITGLSPRPSATLAGLSASCAGDTCSQASSSSRLSSS